MPKQRTYLLSGGGTGGHIFPAVAIAQEIQRRNPEAKILFVGANNRMEMEKVPQSGFDIVGIPISGINRRSMGQNFLFPFKLIIALIKCFFILTKHRPYVVIGTGGFASGPLLWVAQLLKIPTLIQEQNSFPGITNKLLGKKAEKICVAYPELEKFFPKNKIAFTGNPVRKTLGNISKPTQKDYQNFNLDPTRKTLLVLGGSLGAQRVNEAIEKYANKIVNQGYQILWQCGKLYYDELNVKLSTVDHVVLVDFIPNMNAAYGLADIILSRAGAGTISELCLVQKPVILIPSPNVAEDHQTKNAQAMKKAGAMNFIPEKEIDKRLLNEILNLFKDDQLAAELKVNLEKEAKPNATSDIVDEIEKLL